MDDMTDPELKAEEERKAHLARRQERQARRKMREEMAAVALAAAADQAREEENRVDGVVAKTYEGAGPDDQASDQTGNQAGDDAQDRADVGDQRRGGDAATDYSAAAAPTKTGAAALKPKEPPKNRPQKDPPNSVQALARVDPTQVARAPAPGALAEPVPNDAFEIARAQREARMKEIRGELRRRRRLRSLGILVRFLIFVIGPTAFVGWYYYEKATDMYVSESALLFKSGSSGGGGTGLFGALGGGFSTIQDSVALQEYMLSRDILERLASEHDYISHFQSEEIDSWHRLSADANFDEAHSYFKGGLLRSGKLSVSFDAAEGIIRLEVTGATPEAAKRFSTAIISYGEELVNSLNERSRNDGVVFAEKKVAEAKQELRDAQGRVAEVQEQLNIFSVEAEAGGLQTRILGLEVEIDAINGEIAKLQTVAKDPNDSRYVPLRLDLELKTQELEGLRNRLTGGGDETGGPSMAQLSSELDLARVELTTANLLYTSALNSLETAIASATSQSLYLETVVQPSEPQKSDKPARLQNTGLVFLISFALYILGLLTISLIREQAAI